MGFSFLNSIDEANKEIVLTNINEWLINLKNIKINYIFSHILVLSLFLVISFFILGMPIYLFYIFYNGFSLGFIIASLGSIFGLKGYLFSLIYIIITKGLFLFWSFFYFTYLFRIGENCFWGYLKNKNYRKDKLEITVKKSLVFLSFIIISDIFIYFLGGNMLNIFKFLIN